jgi:hypothetical protein
MAVHPRKDPSGRVVGWFAQINYRDHDGGKRQSRRNAKTRNEALDLMAQLTTDRKELKLSGQQAPSTPPEVLTVAAYLNKWLDTRQGLNDSTLRSSGKSVRSRSTP